MSEALFAALSSQFVFPLQDSPMEGMILFRDSTFHPIPARIVTLLISSLHGGTGGAVSFEHGPAKTSGSFDRQVGIGSTGHGVMRDSSYGMR